MLGLFMSPCFAIYMHLKTDFIFNDECAVPLKAKRGREISPGTGAKGHYECAT